MKSIASKLTIALLATAGFSGAALAASGAVQIAQAAEKTEMAPGQVTPQTTDPSARSMDDNTQRQHGKDAAAAVKAKDAGSTGGAMPAGGDGTAAGSQASAGDVRDWSAIDTNKDGSISPEEMEAALKEVGPQAKPSK